MRVDRKEEKRKKKKKSHKDSLQKAKTLYKADGHLKKPSQEPL